MTSKSKKKKQATNHKGMILEIQKLSTEDGPGIRTSIFLKGCPLKCKWCHNPESIPSEQGIQWFKVKCIGCESCVVVCPTKAVKIDKKGVHIDRTKCTICGKCVEECPTTALKLFGTEWTVEDLFYEVEKDKAYYQKSGGGVTVSGGEPLLQRDFVKAFLTKCKENDIQTALDTCGYTTKQNLEKLLEFVDLFLFDIKEINPNKHLKFTDVSNKTILANCIWLVKKVNELGKTIWIRTPIIPNYTATKENVRGIAKFIVNELKNKIDRWDLLAFNNLCKDKYERMDWKWELEKEKLLTEKEMEYYHAIALKEGVQNVRWSGLTQKDENKKKGDKE